MQEPKKKIFSILQRDGGTGARTGELSLPHGRVETPCFMPVGTLGTVKAIHPAELEGMGYKIILSNTYHLYLRPGVTVIRDAGGLHSFIGWKDNILTDSGGYQVFSLTSLKKIKESGVQFQSHLDGSRHFFTPELVVETQMHFGSDIMMPLDVCTPPFVGKEEAGYALTVTTDWARKSLNCWEERGGGPGLLFGIVQGNFYRELRERSAEEIAGMGFPGIAIGGLSVGEEPEDFYTYLTFTAGLLPGNLPRYVMGIGTPDYILHAVENGIDMFDCVFATRIARNGAVITREGILSLKQEKYKTDYRPIDEKCGCRSCTRFSRAYIRHLYKSTEILSAIAASEHNLYFLRQFIREIRSSIENGTFAEYKKTFLEHYKRRDNG